MDERKQTELTMRALEAETNEATFRKLAQEALDVLMGLPDQTVEVRRLSFRILDTLSHIKPVEKRDEERLLATPPPGAS